MIAVPFAPRFDAWRDAARDLLARGVPPDEVAWMPQGEAQGALTGLFAPPLATPSAPALPSPLGPAPRVPRAFLDRARVAACFDDPARWRVLYRIVWRLTHGEPELLSVAVDDDVHALQRWEHAVRRDVHKMHAFVRFVRVDDPTAPAGEAFVAWHRPDHWIVEEAAPFFARRFGAMRWSILGPRGCAWYDGQSLLGKVRYGPPVPREEAPPADAMQDLWCTYYAATFNPARVKERRMKAELPSRHWPTLPETRLIPRLLAEAPARVAAMAGLAPKDAGAWAGSATDLASLAAAARGCRACTLCDIATQTVFGEGPGDARLMLVGEQPGDEEDHAGRPFIGPAGRVLDDALAAAGIDRAAVYVTNAVKHFNHERVGKARLHKRPGGQHVEACRGWLERELRVVAPRVVVCLGATAAHSLLGRQVAVGRARGAVWPGPQATRVLVTWHPSAILRAGDTGGALFTGLVEDLARAEAETTEAAG
ncbi:MAG: UdgX family uracil-DNA binding protein [Myxococcota bacterium]